MATATMANKKQEQGGTFRIIIGNHLGDGPKGCQCDSCANSKGKNHVYRARMHTDPEDYDGDIIESTIDLERRCNQGTSRKFERVRAGDLTSQPPPAYPLEKMTVAQLMSVAEDEEIDLKGASKKEDIIKLLRGAK